MFFVKQCRNLTRLAPSREIFPIQISKKLIMTGTQNPVETSIRNKIISDLNPTHLDIINESYMHNVPKGSETHFKVVIVSEKFENVSLVQRHRIVYDLLEYELKNGVHALSVTARTPAQWSKDNEVNPSPKCLGGKK